MVTVLILEDNQEKLLRIMQVLEEASVTKSRIRHVTNVYEAKQELKEHLYDLLVLDINVPIMQGNDSNRHGGLTLLNTIKERKNIKIPNHIIGLTAFKDIKAEVLGDFEQLQWSILHYDISSDEWFTRLSEKISHIVSAKKQREQEESEKYNCDMCIITAIQSELTAVRSLDLNWERHQDQSDSTVYHRATLELGERRISIIAASACRMGMSYSTALASKMIAKFKPRYIWMLGICAGIKGEVELGDIIVAERSWDYGSGKFKEMEGGEISFFQDPYQSNLDPSLLTLVSLASSDFDFINQIKKEYIDSAPSTDLTLRLGPIVSGAAVISSEKYLNAVKAQCRKLLGIEMEAYGVMCAAELSDKPKPSVIVAKSVCDFADADKADDYQAYAAYTSARFFLDFTKKFLYT